MPTRKGRGRVLMSAALSRTSMPGARPPETRFGPLSIRICGRLVVVLVVILVVCVVMHPVPEAVLGSLLATVPLTVHCSRVRWLRRRHS